MYDDNPPAPTLPIPAMPLALKIDDATIDKVARITGLKLPVFVNAALLNSTLQSVADWVTELDESAPADGWWKRWGSQTFTIVFRVFLAATLTYLAAK